MSKESKSLLIFLCFNLLLGCGRKEQRTPSIRTIELSAIKDTARSADFRLQLVYRAASMAQSDTASAFAEALRQFELEENDMLGALQNQFINDRTDNMVYIPAGRFLAGGFGEFTGEPKDTLLAPFYIDRYLVTNREYAEFLNQYGNQIDGGTRWYSAKIGKVDSTANGFVVQTGFEEHPVVAVTWYGARAYARSMDKRLPSEVEWEKAARGVYGRLYPWGSIFDWNKCNSACYWVKQNLSRKEWEAWYRTGDKHDVDTTPVDMFPSGISPYGCYDMAGNVWQWTSNSYARRWNKGPRRINRGGNFFYGPDQLQTAYRGKGAPSHASIIVGFRCAKDARQVRNPLLSR